jgi:arginase
MSDVVLIEVPYHLGREHVGLGAGPRPLREALGGEAVTALAMLTGSGWEAARATVEGLRPVPEENVVLVGARSIDPGEDERLERSGVELASEASVSPALDALRERAQDAYVHIDLDVLDPAEGKANWWAERGGLTVAQVAHVVDEVASRFRIRAAALTAYDPRCDPEGRIPLAAAAIARRVQAAVERQKAGVR